MTSSPSRLDELMPRYHFRERHGRLVAASPERVYEALFAVTPGEMPLAPALLALRSLPALFAGRDGLPRKGDEPLFPQMLAGSFTLLSEDPGREVVIGVAGQMWRPVGGLVRVRDTAGFLAFNRPGCVKVAMNVRLEARGTGTWISTETRVLAMDEGSRRRFALYWLLIRWGSGAIRRSFLRAIKRRAEWS